MDCLTEVFEGHINQCLSLCCSQVSALIVELISANFLFPNFCFFTFPFYIYTVLLDKQSTCYG